jgi:Zn-dependent M28 family amino/carboxypeptidase
VLADVNRQVQVVENCGVTFLDARVGQLENGVTHRATFYVTLETLIGLPGRSYRGALPPLSADELDVRAALAQHVRVLAAEIGERNVYRPSSLQKAAAYIQEQFSASGYDAATQTYSAGTARVDNIETELRGSADQVLVIGAHYDSVAGCPGANDNASGVAAAMELARLLRRHEVRKRVRFVAFANEEPPFFMTDSMGSVVYARACRARGEKVAGMFSLETIGYYSTDRGSQHYPGPPLFQRLYPDTGDFIGFVSNFASRHLLREAGAAFRRATKFPSEGVFAPASIPGIGWSDHWAF